ncbi:MAG: aminodeoxychorismate synthase component I [Chakrabartia sp.]
MVAPVPAGPFLLLDDARPGGAPARLYARPLEILTTNDPDALPGLLDQIGRGGDWAGFLTYEAGLALEPRLRPLLRRSGLPLIWFARFDGYEEVAADQLVHWLPDPAGGWAGVPRPRLTRADYDQALAKVQSLIEAGDIYQANLTIRADVSIAGDPLALYAGLRQRAQAGFGGVVWTGSDWLLSLSPELFFALKGGKVTTKPMKGTAERGTDPAADALAIQHLQGDPKQRAENLMIVDLLRNDLSRVAVPGSVNVPHLFTVESYPTVHQMISTVTSQLAPGEGVAQLVRAIYPCGSITGAPKIRAMEIVDAVEASPRGIYTGSIGRVDAQGDAAFNVAIRTLHIPAGASTATLGLGGGIVADSRVAEEWAECRAKGRFVADPRRFDLIETMRFDPEDGIAHLDLHLARLAASASALDFAFDRHEVRNELQAATFRLRAAARVRLLLAASGALAIETSDLPPAPPGPVAVAVRPLVVAPGDFRLRHKTTDRRFYDQPRLASGAFEVLFTDPDGFLTEGSFTNIFVQRDGRLLTPPLARGLLPGILRTALLAEGRAVEADLRPDDLAKAEAFFIGNALRGLISARLG